jgi:large subunit ribosomal protein L1
VTTERTLKGRGRRYREIAGLVDRARKYSPLEAVEILKQASRVKFDETVELHVRTGADPRHADQQIRGVAMLPHGTGRARRVMAFVQGPAVAIAEEAGADFIGDDEAIRRIEHEGWADFDVAVATPDMMGRIGRLGRFLGRKGLMPNPRTGTVVQAEDLPNIIRESKQGRVEFRMDRSGNIHSPIGKVSFEPQALLENLAAVVEAITRSRAEGIKGNLYRAIYLTSSMGPSCEMNILEVQAIEIE